MYCEPPKRVKQSGITTINSGQPAAMSVSSRSSSDGVQGLSFKSIRPRPVKPVSTNTTG
jgi:hypothetical protein